MNRITFEIPVKMDSGMSLNKVYGGKHWTTRKKDADIIHGLVRMVLAATRPKPELFTAPVAVTIEYNCRLDIDNCGYMSKLIIDGMKGILIKDDSPKYVRSLVQKFYDGKRIRVTVEEVTEDGNEENDDKEGNR